MDLLPGTARHFYIESIGLPQMANALSAVFFCDICIAFSRYPRYNEAYAMQANDMRL